MNFLVLCYHVIIDLKIIVDFLIIFILAENDWRLAQYLIRHKQRPSFLLSPNTWSDYSNSNTSLTAASSSPVPRNQELNTPVQTSSLFLPVSSSSSSSNSSSSSASGSDSESSSSSSESGSSDDDEDDNNDDDDDDDDDYERNILFALQEAQQQRLVNSSPLRPSTESAGKASFIDSNHRILTDILDVDNHLNDVGSSNNNSESSDQRSQIVSSSLIDFYSRFI